MTASEGEYGLVGRHARRRGPATLRRVGIPLVALGVGLVPLVGAPASAATASPAAPSGETSSSTPCAKTVKACAMLSTNEAWVTDGHGTVLRGPVRISHGGDGEETPTGSFTVLRKDAQHVSQEQAGVKMPWSVFFDGHGRAFHGGSTDRQSAGCVHLADDDAQFFFSHLAVGDAVQILP